MSRVLWRSNARREETAVHHSWDLLFGVIASHSTAGYELLRAPTDVALVGRQDALPAALASHLADRSVRTLRVPGDRSALRLLSSPAIRTWSSSSRRSGSSSPHCWRFGADPHPTYRPTGVVTTQSWPQSPSRRVPRTARSASGSGASFPERRRAGASAAGGGSSSIRRPGSSFTTPCSSTLPASRASRGRGAEISSREGRRRADVRTGRTCMRLGSAPRSSARTATSPSCASSATRAPNIATPRAVLTRAGRRTRRGAWARRTRRSARGSL